MHNTTTWLVGIWSSSPFHFSFLDHFSSVSHLTHFFSRLWLNERFKFQYADFRKNEEKFQLVSMVVVMVAYSLSCLWIWSEDLRILFFNLTWKEGRKLFHPWRERRKLLHWSCLSIIHCTCVYHSSCLWLHESWSPTSFSLDACMASIHAWDDIKNLPGVSESLSILTSSEGRTRLRFFDSFHWWRLM